MKHFAIRHLLLILICWPVLAVAQEKPNERPERARSGNSYRLDLQLSENENGKRTNTRNYSFVVEDRRSVRLRQGLRVPIVVGTPQIPTTGPSPQIQYMDVGLNLDCEVSEADNGVRVNLSVDESSFSSEQQQQRTGGNPVVRQIRSQLMAIIPQGKQTLVSSAEELDSKKRIDIEVTATKLR